MPIEVITIDGLEYSHRVAYESKTESVAAKIKEVYEDVLARRGTIIGQHVLPGLTTTPSGKTEVIENTLYLIVDIPAPIGGREGE